MDPILIGISILLIGIIAFVYIKLSRKIDTEVLNFNKKLENIIEQPTNKPILIPKLKQQLPVSPNNSNYTNLKAQYDSYVQENENNFDNCIYDDDIPENIKNEIDNISNIDSSNIDSSNIDSSNIDSQFFPKEGQDTQQYEPTEEVQYEPTEEGQYEPTEEGQYEPTKEGQYEPTEEVQDTQQYVPTEEVQATQQYEPTEKVQATQQYEPTEEVPNKWENIFKDTVDDNIKEGHIDVIDEYGQFVQESKLNGEQLYNQTPEILVEDTPESLDTNTNSLVEQTDELLDTNADSLEDIGEHIKKDEVKYKDLTLEEINNLTVKELQFIARKNKLKIKGKKDELLERVKSLYNLNINMK